MFSVTRSVCVLFPVACSLVPVSALAETITWTGGAGTSSWHTAANWDLNRVPGAGDDVIIPSMTPDVNVTHSTGTTTINSLTSAEAFTLNGGTLTVNATSSLNGSFTVTGNGSATLNGSGDILANGAMSWTSGTMSGSGRTIVSATGSLAVSATALKVLGRRLENHSPNAICTALSIQINNGILSNESDGVLTFNLTSSPTIASSGGTNAVVNAGIINKSGAGTLTLGTNIPFNNSGTFNLDAGGLTLNGGGTNTGTIDADASTTLTFSSSYTHDNASALTGQGTLTFTTVTTNNIACTLSTDRTINIGGVVNFNAAYTFTGTVNLTATLGGSGDITIAGVLNWPSGTMTGTGKTIVAPTGNLVVSQGASTHDLRRTLENHSPNATWTATSISFNGGTLTNEADGTLNFSLASNVTIFAAGAPNAVVNAGVINKSGSGTITIGQFGSNITFNNSGTFNLDAGGLTLNGGGTNTGTIDADASTTLTFSSSYTHDNASALTGQGTLTFTTVTTNNIACTLSTDRTINIGGVVNFNAAYTFTGTVNLTATLGGSGDITIAGALNWTNNGSMTGAGRTTIAPTGTLTVSDGFSKNLGRRLENHSPNATWTATSVQFNNGVLSNGSDGTLTFNLAASPTFVSIGGMNSIVNTGVMNKMGTGTLTIGANIPLTNSGTINVQAGTLSMTTLTNFSGTALTGGTYYVAGTLRFTGANIATNAANIVLDGPSSAIQNTSGGNALANFATNTAAGTFQIKNGRNFALSGAFSNDGFLTLGPGDNAFGASTMGNSGTITKSAKGTGNINATVSLTGSGLIDVQEGTLTLTTLTNFSGTTLTGGGYRTTGILRFGNANIAQNAANIILDGPTSAIQNTLGADALAGLASNAAGGAIQITNGRNLALSGDFSNAGQVTIGPGDDTLSLPGTYVQSAGFTRLDGGSLDPAELMDIQGGELKGSGQILGSVKNAATCAPGMSPGSISITADYTQTLQGTYEAEIGGTVQGTGYDHMAVDGRALLPGTLNLSLINGFVPSVGDSFDIITGSVSVKFATIALPLLPDLKGWQFEDTLEALRIMVVDCGPGDADGDGVGDACETAPDLSWHTIDGGGATFSSGGPFRLGATIGQPDAGVLTGGEFELIGGFWAAALPGPPPPGDCDGDGDVDPDDYAPFPTCLTGPGNGLGPSCECLDLDADGDVDLLDFAEFEVTFE